MIADDSALEQIAEFAEANGGSARYTLKILLDALEEAGKMESRKITVEIVKKTLEKEKKDIVLSKLHELKQEAPREFKVLRVIAELTTREVDVYTGMIKDAVRKKGLMVCRRSLEYYLGDLDRRGFVKLENVRIGKGHSTSIDLIIPSEAICELSV
jgi:Cdc6-like AAA superfamily ATPase